MDQSVRIKLRNVVTQCRKLLEDATGQALQGRFGIYAARKKGEVQIEDEARMAHLTEEDLDCRQDLLDHLAHIQVIGYKPSEALEQLIREIAFTHLNRLCAYKMMESRGLIRETVSRGLKSQGFFFYLADYPDDEKLHKNGQQDVAYRKFLDWLGGTLSEEIGVLFNPDDPANRIYPPQRVLDQVLALINDDELKDIWSQDETIGWVYQYFTPKELRDKARKESRSPRNSYELAFRNQFFTPRYVVEFLTDNTLGRIWYEMRKGETVFKERCQYLVRRPTEIFLKEGEAPPEESKDAREDLSQEELLKLPVHIPHRPKKDPRELKILDPACGSGHFLLYCFDLLQVIYEEAYDDPDLGKALRKDYSSIEDLRRDVPGLILKNNLYGIDIDLRATQIAVLALWLRCQRAYQEMLINNGERPKITRSNIICAEPMPGETDLLKEFTASLQPKVLGQLVGVVFEKMKVAGEAGSLLKIEEEIREAARKAKTEYIAWKKHQEKAKGILFPDLVKRDQPDLFDFADLTDEAFLDRAEGEIVEALCQYAEQKGNGKAFRRRLFAEDAAQGFSFIELCHRRFDVILMNPPFGELSKNSKTYIKATYKNSYSDILAAFVERTLELSVPNGFVGAITNRSCFYLKSLVRFRSEVLQRCVGFEALMDLGEGVLDAMVEAAAYVLRHLPQPTFIAPFLRLLNEADKASVGLDEIRSANLGMGSTRVFYSSPIAFSRLASSPFCYWVPGRIINSLASIPAIEGSNARIVVGLQTGYDWQFLRNIWEVSPRAISPCPLEIDRKPSSVRSQCLEELRESKVWAFYSKTDAASPWYSPITLVVKWERNGFEIKNFTNDKGKVRSRPQNETFYFRPGYSYMTRTTRIIPYLVPSGVIPMAVRSTVYSYEGKEIETLGLLASRFGSAVARFFGEMFARPMFQASMVQSIPAVSISADTRTALQQRFNSELAEKRNVLSHFEPWHEFVLPAILDNLQSDDAWQLDSLIGMDLEERIAQDAGLSKEDLKTLCRDLDDAVSIRSKSAPSMEEGENDNQSDEAEQDGDYGDDNSISLVDLSPRAQNEGLISYCLGVVFGRWDVRFAQNRSLIPRSQDVLDPLPVVPPGTLVSPDGYPAKTGNIVSEAWLKARPNAVYLPAIGSVPQTTIPEDKYPTRIDWDGILVDDSGHEDDIIRRVRDVLEVIRKNRAESIEKETCEILGVKELRDYFRKPGNGGFWMDHVKRYSKSRRKAPIYWYLRSAKGNYGLWLYYHRLDKDILFKALLNYVEPKIRLEEDRLNTLRSRKEAAGSSGREAKQIEKDMDRQEQFVSELHDFKDKLRRAADLHLEPDLNDGVVLNIAPLWELVPWKEAKKYWEELNEGKYEWSSMGKQLREKEVVK